MYKIVNLKILNELFGLDASIYKLAEVINGADVDGDLVLDAYTGKIFYINCVNKVIRETHLNGN